MFGRYLEKELLHKNMFSPKVLEHLILLKISICVTHFVVHTPVQPVVKGVLIFQLTKKMFLKMHK